MTSHRMSHAPEYKAWDNARGRCYRPNDNKYPLYGGRGIGMCERWRNSFINFIADMGRRPSASHSLERKDSNGDYCPENCVWATGQEQNNNRPSYNRYVTLNGEKLTLAQASRAVGVPHATIRGRLKRGWSDEETLNVKERLRMVRQDR